MSVPECLAKTLPPGTVWPVQIVISGKVVFATGIGMNDDGEWLISYKDPLEPKHHHIKWITPTAEQKRAKIVP